MRKFNNAMDIVLFYLLLKTILKSPLSSVNTQGYHQVEKNLFITKIIGYF